MIELASVVLGLQARSDAVLPLTHGKAVQALLLDLIDRFDSPLAEELHCGSSLRPYTVSPLAGDAHALQEMPRVRKGQHYSLRFTGLTRKISKRLVEMSAKKLPPIRLLSASFLPTRWTVDPNEDAEACSLSYSEFCGIALLRGSSAKQAAMEFLTPTSFNGQLSSMSDAGNIPLPVPYLVFQNIWQKWQAFAPARVKRLKVMPLNVLNAESVAAMIQSLTLDQFSIASHDDDFQKSTQTGFTGRCVFSLGPKSPETWAHAFRLLTEYSFFCGVGRQTTWGKGQARLLSAAPTSMQPHG